MSRAGRSLDRANGRDTHLSAAGLSMVNLPTRRRALHGPGRQVQTGLLL